MFFAANAEPRMISLPYSKAKLRGDNSTAKLRGDNSTAKLRVTIHAQIRVTTQQQSSG